MINITHSKIKLISAFLGILFVFLSSAAFSQGQTDSIEDEPNNFSVTSGSESPSANNTSGGRNAPIEIEADSAEQNETQGTITYRGNVLIQQAEISIQAEKVIISSAKEDKAGKRQLNTIVATGEPASFTHNPVIATQSVYAQAETIVFNVQRNLIQLEKNAQLNQNQSSVQGKSISYDISKRRVNANSGDDSSNSKQRVKTIISPDGNLLPQIR